MKAPVPFQRQGLLDGRITRRSTLDEVSAACRDLAAAALAHGRVVR